MKPIEPDLRHLGAPPKYTLLIHRPKNSLYVIFYDWLIFLKLKPHVTFVYAIVLSLKARRAKTRLADIVKFAQRAPRSVRRDLATLEGEGFLVRRPRYSGGKRRANDIELLWPPAAPPELRGPIYVPNTGSKSAAHDLAMRPVQAPGDRPPVAAQFKNAEDPAEQAGSSPSVDVQVVSSDVLSALNRTIPGHVEDCFRVLREYCKSMSPQEARGIWLVALKKLIARCERGEVNNPPGLLRSCLLGEAVSDVSAAAEALHRSRTEAQLGSLAALRARTGFEAIRAMRKRAQELRAQGELHTDPVEAIAVASADDPGLAELLNEVDRLIEVVRAAHKRGDCTVENRAQEGLHRLERKLDDHIKQRRDSVS